MKDLSEVVSCLNRGGIIIFPTDTAFGIGCRLDKPESVARLFQLRNRPPSQATPVLVDSFTMAQKYWLSPLPDIVRHLADKYWPGGLTLIFKADVDSASPLVRGYGDNIGLRMPDHETALSLIKRVRVPILGPSANFHGQKTPYDLKDVDKELIKVVDYVVPGICKTKLASTVVDCTHDPVKILREGAVKLDL